jgi:NAD+ kinase
MASETVHMRTGIIHHDFVPEANTLAQALIDRYSGDDEWWSSSVEDASDLGESLVGTDLIIAIGGDGTILRSAHVAAPLGIPILGVNLGRVGFMSEIEADDALDEVAWYLEGNARPELRTMIKANIGDGPVPHHALNDVVLGRGQEIRLVDIALTIDDVPLTTYRSDALVISTASGSTGYSLALGGPVMEPEEESFLVKPVASHMSLQGGLLIKSGSVVEMTLETDTAALCSVDGFYETTVTRGQTVRVEVSEYTATFLRRKPPSAFYDALTRRLGMRQGSMQRTSASSDD